MADTEDEDSTGMPVILGRVDENLDYIFPLHFPFAGIFCRKAYVLLMQSAFTDISKKPATIFG
jgi:hypothetical protein